MTHVTSATDAESLFAQYSGAPARYLSRAAGEREVARDLTQEVFLRVSRTAIPTAPEHQLAGWLFKIAETWRSTTTVSAAAGPRQDLAPRRKEPKTRSRRWRWR